MSNTAIWEEDWVLKLQERLSENNKWKEICNVVYTDSRVMHNPYMADAAVQSGTRGTAYTMQDAIQTDDSITISTYKILPQLIDRADLAQSSYLSQMNLADRQGILLNEAIETAVYAAYASFTTFGDIGGGALGISGSPVAFTVSASNVDDIIRGIKREVRTANGEALMDRNGVFMIWRPADFELLEAYAQANGFQTADGALSDGTNQGFSYMGVEHYSSNKLAAGHLIGGVKKVIGLGIVKSTYGQIVITQDPLNVSAIGVISRVDYAVKAWHNIVPVVYNILVN